MRRLYRITLAAVLALATPGFAADTAVLVSPSELHQKLADRAAVRRDQIQQVRGLLSFPQARKALAATRMDAGKVAEAVALLDDAELARLSSRASRAQADFAAGALSNQELTYIVIALATAVIILVIVAA